MRFNTADIIEKCKRIIPGPGSYFDEKDLENEELPRNTSPSWK